MKVEDKSGRPVECARCIYFDDDLTGMEVDHSKLPAGSGVCRRVPTALGQFGLVRPADWCGRFTDHREHGMLRRIQGVK